MGHDMEKNFFPKCRSSLVKLLHPRSIFRKNHFKVLKIANMCQKVTFSCISYTKHPYKGPFTPKSFRSSVPTVYRPQTNVFLKPQASLYTKNIVGKVAPPLDFLPVKE